MLVLYAFMGLLELIRSRIMVRVGQRIAQHLGPALFERVTNARFEEVVPPHIYVFDGASVGNPFLLGRGVGGYFAETLSGNFIAVYTGGGFDPFQTIGHEYLHYLMRNRGGVQYPQWYDEGFAEVLSHSRIRGTQIDVGVTPTWRLQTLQQAGELLPLRLLMETRHYAELDERGRLLFYAQAWLATHYFYFGKRAGFPDRSRQVRRYLRLVNEGWEPARAVPRAFEVDFYVLDYELRRYLRRARFPTMPVPLAALEPGSVGPPTHLPPDRALERLGELRLHVLGHDESRSAVRLTRGLFRAALDANPQNARAHAGLALFESDARRARTRLERALALAPDDPLVTERYASWLSERAEVDRARTLYRRTIELAPEHPAGHAGLGQTYLHESSNFGPGIEALERAQRMLPGNLEVALALGELQLKAGNRDRARRQLETVARWSHGGPNLQRAYELLEEIEREASR